MSKIESYIEKLRGLLKENPEMSELELIKYVYMDLGNRFKFDINFLPFGNSKQRQKIYKDSSLTSEWEKGMETDIVICRTASYIVEHVLKPFGVNIKTVVAPNDLRKCPHVYNVVTLKDGREFIMDLQEDMYNIQSHSFTKNFGLSVKDNETAVITRFEQEQIDRKLGYIDDENYYANDYLYLIKSDMGYFETFREKVRFILENIDVYDNPEMSHIDRQWHHVRVLEELLSEKEFDYRKNDSRIKMLDCYKDIKGKRQFVNAISVQVGKETDMYIYNKSQYKYCYITLKNFAKAVKNGLVVHGSSVPGLGNCLKNLKNEEETR